MRHLSALLIAFIGVLAVASCASESADAVSDGGIDAGVTDAHSPEGPAPTLASLQPSRGATAGGDLVVLGGTGFEGVREVRFGTSSALFRLMSSERIEAVAPPGTGAVDVRVLRGGSLSNTLPYVYEAPAAPTMTGLAPAAGPAAGGTAVVLTGTGLANASRVAFGSRAAGFTVESDTRITAFAPAGTGSVDVVVTTPAGITSPVRYAYDPAVGLLTLTPHAGPTAGGTSVTLTGSRFTGASAVSFGNVPATSFTVDADTQITAVAPAGTGVVQVQVTTPSGKSNEVSYNYVSAPTLSALRHDFGALAGGNEVVLTGSGFTGATAVRFGASPAVAFSVDSDTQITALSPAQSAGTVPVVVTGVGGESNGVSYEYLSPAFFVSISPKQGPTAGGTLVTVVGHNMRGVSAITFDGVPGTDFTFSPPQTVTVRTPPHAAGPVTVGMTAINGAAMTPNGFTYVAP